MAGPTSPYSAELATGMRDGLEYYVFGLLYPIGYDLRCAPQSERDAAIPISRRQGQSKRRSAATFRAMGCTGCRDAVVAHRRLDVERVGLARLYPVLASSVCPLGHHGIRAHPIAFSEALRGGNSAFGNGGHCMGDHLNGSRYPRGRVQPALLLVNGK